MCKIKQNHQPSEIYHLSPPPDYSWTSTIENRASNLLDINPKQHGKRRVEVGDGLGVVKTAGSEIVDLTFWCEGGIDFGVVSSDFGGFVYHDKRGNMHPGR